MKNVIIQDMQNKVKWYDRPVTTSNILRMMLSDGSGAQITYRLMRFCQTHHLKPLALFLYRYNAWISHALIGRGADFGPGFVLVHSIGVVINSDVKAGKNLVIEHGVTIGAEKFKSPSIGDNVFIGAGAKIIGAVKIGNDVKIGANAVVTHDLPDGATAVGAPARVVRIYGERISKSSPKDEDLFVTITDGE